MATLKLTAAAGDVERELPLDNAPMTLGRAEDTGWPLEDDAASRRHAEIALTPEGYVIRDLGSSNGTWVNRTRIETHVLVDGDEIKIGGSTLIFSRSQIDEATVMVDMANLPNTKAAPTQPDAAPPTPPPPPAQPVSPPSAQAAAPPPAPAAAIPATPPPVAKPVTPPPAEPPAQVVKAQPSQPEPKKPAAATSARRPQSGAQWQQKIGVVLEKYKSWLEATPDPPRADAGEAAGFGVRLGAYVIDAMILGAVMILIMTPIGLLAAVIGSKSTAIAMLLSLFGWILIMVISVGYVLVPWALVGITPGKRLLGLKIVRADGGSEPLGYLKAGLRMVGYMASGALFCAGFIMVAFTKDHKGLHDMIADTKVVRS